MDKNKKIEIAWWPANSNNISEENICNSVPEAINQAQEQFRSRTGVFSEDNAENLSVIRIGVVQRLDLKNAIRSIMEDFEDKLYDTLDGTDYALGTELEVQNNNIQEFSDKATELLLPLIQKYFYVYPDFTAQTIKGSFDLGKWQWLDED